MMENAEYYVARVAGKTSMKSTEKEFFTVTKFEGGDEPKAVYMVVWNKTKDQMECECPNKRRSAHIDDKHGEVVRLWLSEGEPSKAYAAKAQYRNSRPSRASDGMEPGDSPDDDIPF